VPPQTIISLSVHTAVWPYRASGALVVLVALQLSVLGSYLPPVLNIRAGMVSPTGVAVTSSTPDDHLAASPNRCVDRAVGALVSVVGVHVSSVQPPEGLAITGSW